MKNYTNKLLNLIFKMTILFTVASCIESTEPLSYKRSQKNELRPLDVGNYWNYQYDCGDTSLSPTWFVFDTITRDTNVNSTKWFEDKRKNYHLNSSQGYQETYDFKTFLYFKYPCNVGDLFELVTNTNNYAKVLSNNDLVTVPAGTFKCYRYYYKDTTFVYDNYNQKYIQRNFNEHNFYYAVGVGLILHKVDVIAISGDVIGTQRKKLFNYNVN